ncbi:unnamed protein product [Coregonus sp. 'balchen']|nr:unnamed protein product [Coregonus sp. 'balchen']
MVILELFVSAFLKFDVPVASQINAKLYGESETEVDGEVFEKVLTQPSPGVFTITLDNDTDTVSSQITSSFASSLLEILSIESDDTVILSDDGSPSRKRQRAEDEAKHVRF